jgi:hypothetical protein
MMTIKQCILILLFTGLSIVSKSQYTTTGDDPASIHWRQINTAHFQVIYPSEFEAKAQHLTSILNKVYDYAGQTLNHNPHKISVILHTETVMSNGMVSWAPKRVDLFTTPPQDTYAQEWLSQLAIHEFRHVVQIDKIASELPNIFNIILGEQAAALVVGAYLPFWYLEGDAVAAETALSNSGRGRLPSFEMELKAQTLDRKIYSFDKSYLGSYRDYVPDYYQSGYQLVAGIRSKYGVDTWPNVMHHIARNPLSIFALSNGLRKNTGKNQAGLYNETFNNLRIKWKQDDEAHLKSGYEKVTKDQRNYTSYRFPYFTNDSIIFAVKYSINDLTRFVFIYPNGREKKIFTPGNLSDESVSVSDNRIFWIEKKPDTRWSNKEVSLLRIYNIKDGKIFQKAYQEKIFAPVLSPDGRYLACVKVDDQSDCSILLLDPNTGEIMKDIPAPDHLFFITPSWAENGNELFAVVLGGEGKALVKFNLITNKMSHLLPFSYNNIVRPVQKGNYVFFNNSQSGIDNIYAFDLVESKTFKVTDSRYGTSDPQLSKDGKSVIYCDYTANGFSVVRTQVKQGELIPIDISQSFKYGLADKIASQERGIINFNKIDSTLYQSENYSKFTHLFNFHSWAPFYIDTNNEELSPGFSLLSQNKLSTAVTQIGYDYSTANKTGKWFAKFDYTGLYPIIGFETDYGNGKSQYYQITHYRNQQGQIVRTDTTLVGFNYSEFNINGKLKIPFNLSQGKMYRLIQPEFQITYTDIKIDSSVPHNIFHGNVIPLTYRLYANNYLALSTRDIQPRIGGIIDLVYRNTPFGDHNYGTIWSAEGTLFLPGFVKHHGFRIYGGYQQKSSSESSYLDIISYPRGYQSFMNTELFTVKSDYVMPLFYPDWSLGKLSYFKRISLRMFYDYGRAIVPVNQDNNTSQVAFSSLGGELTIDCHFLRFIVPSTIGIRESYLIESKSSYFEMLFAINFNQFRTSK